MLRVEKVGAHELKEFLREFVGKSWSKSSLDRLTRKEEYVGLPTDSFIGQGRTYNFLRKFRASMRHTREDTRGAP